MNKDLKEKLNKIFNVVEDNGNIHTNKNTESKINIGDTVRYNGTIWVKVKDIKGKSALVSPIHKDDVELKKFGKEELVPLGSLRTVEEVHRVANENNKEIYPDVDEKIYKKHGAKNMINKDGSLKVDKAKIYKNSEINNIPDNTPVATSWLNTDGSFSSYVFKDKKGTLYDKETIKGLDNKTFKSRKAANNYALRKGYNVLESKTTKDEYKSYPITSDETNFVDEVIIHRNSKGYLQVELINKELDATVGRIVFSNNLEEYRQDYSALTGGREELRRKWHNLDIISLANEIKDIIRKNNLNESKINEEIKGNNLNSKWVIRAWMDNMDSEDGYDEIEFTKIGLIDFINSEEERYYGDSYDYQTEPIEYDITDEELKTAINDNVFVWVFGDTASVVSIDGKAVNENLKLSDVVDKEEKDFKHIEDIVDYIGKQPFGKKEKEYAVIGFGGNEIDVEELHSGKKDTITLNKNFKSRYKESKIEETQESFKIYIYDEETGELSETISPETFQSAKTILYNLSDKNNGKLVYPRPLDTTKEDAKKKSDDFKLSCSHIYQNNGNFLKRYGDLYFSKNRKENKMNEAKDNTIKIFLTNLGKYNEGDLVGEWVTLPVDDFQPILDRIGIDEEYEEWFITDYEAPFEIGEYDNIDELNEIAEAIENFDATELEVLKTYEENGYDMQTAIEKVRDNDYFYLEASNEEDLAYAYIDAIGDLDSAVSKENQERYFDYEAFGRDLSYDFYQTDNGYVQLD